MSQTADEHRRDAQQSHRCAVVTVSDTRTPQTDRSGSLVAELLVAAGHEVISRQIVPDEPEKMEPLLEALAAMLSRATGGLVGRTVVLTMPGSPAAVKLAMEKLILPELGHLVREANR